MICVESAGAGPAMINGRLRARAHACSSRRGGYRRRHSSVPAGQQQPFKWAGRRRVWMVDRARPRWGSSRHDAARRRRTILI
jgi:hypothetical protein